MKTLLVSILLVIPYASFSQGEAALPFLLIHTAPDANGWGNVGTAVASDNPISMIANPAQTGLFSLGGYFAAATYAGKTQWLPQFQQSDLTYNAWALNAGYDLSKIIPLPFPIGIAVGYSRVDLNLGRFVRTGSGGPEPLGAYEAFERAEGITAGLALEYFVQLGLGMRFNNIVSSLGSIGNAEEEGPGRTEVSATDFGLLLTVPVTDIVQRLDGGTITLGPDFSFLANITAGYSYRNHNNGSVIYIFAQRADPFPRTATVGLSLEVGLTRTTENEDWKVLTISLAREAEDVLVSRRPDGSFSYQSGLGDIAFFKHVIQGKLPDSDRVNLHQGWQLNLAEILHIRGGSFAESPFFGNRNYTTSGIGIRTTGLFKLIETISPGALSGGVGNFVKQHIEVAYDRASYSAEAYHPLDGTVFQSMTLTVR